jgi:hypothetical protein
MDGGIRLSAVQHRHQAMRWRQLAAEATTPQTKKHLLALARDYEARAGDLMPIRAARREEPKFLDTPP